MDKAVHLGDGAYATFDGYAIVLTSNHHDQELADDIIYLEPSVIRALVNFAEAHGFKVKVNNG